jgi:hypothetical protein
MVKSLHQIYLSLQFGFIVFTFRTFYYRYISMIIGNIHKKLPII